MKKFLFYSLALVFAGSMAACSSTEKDAEHNDHAHGDSTHHHSSVKANPNMVADLGISGMVCQMNCVGSVEKTLLGMAGVVSMDIDFDPEQNVNHAFVKFDDKIVTKDEMIKAIESLNDNQYKVESVDVKPVTGQNSSDEEKPAATSSNAKSVDQSSAMSDLSVTGIFDVLVNVL
jgi:copper chaperone CopZ